MTNKKMLNKKGAMNAFMVFGVLVLAIALPVAVFLTQKNQESRSSAATDNSMGICGSATGEYFSSKPSDESLCDGGVLIWNDEKADDGDWNWTCKGDPAVADSDKECLAAKE